MLSKKKKQEHVLILWYWPSGSINVPQACRDLPRRFPTLPDPKKTIQNLKHPMWSKISFFAVVFYQIYFENYHGVNCALFGGPVKGFYVPVWTMTVEVVMSSSLVLRIRPKCCGSAPSVTDPSKVSRVWPECCGSVPSVTRYIFFNQNLIAFTFNI